jgi:hypothetical protein
MLIGRAGAADMSRPGKTQRPSGADHPTKHENGAIRSCMAGLRLVCRTVLEEFLSIGGT